MLHNWQKTTGLHDDYPIQFKCKRCGHGIAITQEILDKRFNGSIKEWLATVRRCPVGPGGTKDAAARLGVSLDDAKHYASALSKWAAKGFPRRSQKEVERIERECCIPCEKYVNGKCGECHCKVNKGPAVVNKIRMATEDCPLGKWNADRERIILHCDLSPGDVLVLTAAVESLHKLFPDSFAIDIRCPVPDIWENNPRVTTLPDDDSDIRHVHMEYPLVHQSGQRLSHFIDGYTENLGKQLGIELYTTTRRPHLYLGRSEKCWGNPNHDDWAAELFEQKKPFWLINAGVKDDFTAKQWPVEYYQEVVNRTQGDMLWVQVGDGNHNHPRLDGVIDMLGKTDHRRFIRLAYQSQGGLGPSTYLQHIMAAWDKPYVCILGGREPVSWVQYQLQTTLHTIGSRQLPCCREHACWKSRVVDLDDGKEMSLCERPVTNMLKPVAECMAMIKPDDVLAALKRMR